MASRICKTRRRSTLSSSSSLYPDLLIEVSYLKSKIPALNLHLLKLSIIPHYSSSFKMLFFQTLLPLISALCIGLIKVTYATLVTHDESFVPDAILRVTEEETKQSCVPEKNILLVNGTSPGPELRFKENQTIWIRVYNDVHDQNLTMVKFSIYFPSSIPRLFLPDKVLKDTIVMLSFQQKGSFINVYIALARSYNGNSSFLRRYTSSLAMAYSTLTLF